MQMRLTSYAALAWLVGTLCLASPLASHSAPAISGPASIVDGDTLLIAGEVVDLKGIDAPESAQLCVRDDGTKWPCGRRVVDALRDLIADRPVTCQKMPRNGGRESAGASQAVCALADGREINGLLVEAGLAVTHPKSGKTYLAAEARARRAQRGLWASFFEPPADYRARRWDEASARAPDPACPIKGNIDKDGERLYLMPHSHAYGWVRIEARRGERWFCSEQDAMQAGWRAPLAR